MEHVADNWWMRAKIYELYIDKFAGNLSGLTAHLDYFTTLGINCIHFLPHYPSPMVDDGYDVMDYRSVRPELGTIEDFTNCVVEAKKRGIRIVVDLVLNHVSDQHPWFIEARSSRNNAKRDYFLWSDTTKKFEGAVNAFPGIKPSNWIRNEATEDHYFATFYPVQPDLNWDNPRVMEEMLAVIDLWIARGVSGFRLDAAPHLVKRDNTDSNGLPETHQILKRIRAHLDRAHPEVILIAEAHQSVPMMQTYFGRGDECHMAYHFSLAEQFLLALKRGDARLVERMLERSSGIPKNCAWTTYLRSHDEVSLTTIPKEERIELVDFLDPTHEYAFEKGPIKGPSTAVRLASGLHGDRKKILEAFTLLYRTPGTPVMYYGDEIGMMNLPLQMGIIDSRKYVRGAFDWEEAERQMKDPASLWNEVAKLIHHAK